MKKHSENSDNWETLRQKVIGLGETSVRKNYYAELQNRLDELERFKFILDNSGEEFYLITKDGNFDYVNDAAANGLGYSITELLEKDIFQIDAFGKKEDFIEHINRLKSGDIPPFEVTHKTKDGKLIPKEVKSVYLKLAGKEYICSFARDISERKKSDRLKSEFLAQVSHEIRTPVNTILNYISLVKEELQTAVSDELQKSFKAIDNGSRRLIKTIDSLINMSQVQTGNYDFKPAKIDLEKDIIESLILDYHYQVKSKGIELEYKNEAGSSIVTGDIHSITQILSNLIDNAVKYTAKGKIEIRLLRQDNFLIVEISDTGIGISEEYMPYIFEPFSQEETGYTRRFDGNGLGLALVLKYCELNKAQINVESKKGEGTTFKVAFRLS